MELTLLNKRKTKKFKVLLPRMRYLDTSLTDIQQQIQLKRCKVKLRKYKLKKAGKKSKQLTLSNEQNGEKLRELVIRLPRLYPPEAISDFH